MFSGAAYGLIGIRFKYFHVFFSAAYLTSLAVAVLIIYVMSLPVSNRIQGAYVAASIMAGVIVGGASLVLVEMMQGLGCLLGGFTLSMWLLTLRPGGLISSRSGRVGFIAALTLAGFCTSFSHITRPYALIVFISFSGSTAIVLGIDCFSRAGLKEFWVYLWDINEDLFAIGTTTYPLDKGIYAEIAVIFILSLAGIASQAKLWKDVREKRQQRAAGQLEEDKARADEEANTGRDLGSSNAREREQWEAAHGNKDEVDALPFDQDSGVGDMDSQKKSPVTTITSVLHPEQDEIEAAQTQQHSPAAHISHTPVRHSQGSVGSGPETITEGPPERELDADGNSILNSTNRSSYASAKHLSGVSAANLDESSPQLPNLGEPKSEVSELEGSSPEEPSVERPNLEDLASTAKENEEASAVGKEPPQVSENHVPHERSASQMSEGAKSAKLSQIKQISPISSSSEPQNGCPDGNASPRTSQSPVELQSANQSVNDHDIHSSASLEASQSSTESPMEDDLGPLPSSTPSTRRSSCIPFGDNTLMGRRDSMLRNKTNYSPASTARDSTGSLPSQLPGNVSRQGSSSGESVYNRDYGLHSSTSLLDDNMPLSARRSLLRQPSFPSNPPHSARRQYSGPSPMAREQQLASFRMGIQRERHSSIVPNVTLERQRSALWQERQVEGQKKAIEKRRKEEKESAFDQTMRRGDMQNAHREAMRKMQAIANKHV